MCTQQVAVAWFETLMRINPALASDEVRGHLEDYVAALVQVLRADPFDSAPAQDVGRKMVSLDSFQPNDLVAAQEGLVQAFAGALSSEAWQAHQSHISLIAFNLGAGFHAAQQQRAAKFGTEAMSRMAHDLKTPINAITGFSRVILKGIDGPITEFQREDLTSIYEAGKKLLTMINDVFAIRKHDAGRTLVHDGPFQVSELLGDVFLTIQLPAAGRDHTLQVTASGDLGQMAQDVSSVRWVLLSLLLYAVRQAARGFITLSAEREFSEEEWIVFVVGYKLPQDLEGYREERPADLWQSSFEAETDDGGWLDEIGLTVCRRFCEEMHGSVIRSESDEEGVAFTVRLPAGS